jgi:adenosylhomocysteine nucleosidase
MMELAINAASGASPKKLSRISTEIQQVAQELSAEDAIDEQLSRDVALLKVRVAANSVDAARLHAFAVDGLQRCVHDGRRLLDEIDAQLTYYGRLRPSTTFRHAALVEIQPLVGDRGAAVTKMRQIADAIRAELHDGGGRSRMLLLPTSYEGFTSGQWVVASGPKGWSSIALMARRLFDELPDVRIRLTAFVDLLASEGIVLSDRSAHFAGRNFWSRAHGALQQQAPTWEGQQFVMLTPGTLDNTKSIRRQLGAALPSLAKIEERVISVAEPVPATFVRSRMKSSNSVAPVVLVRKAAGYDVGIITIVTEEMQAASEQFGLARRQGQTSARSFYVGEIPAKGGVNRVVATQQVRQGNASVMSAWYALQQEFAPALMVLLGIAGGMHQDVGLCDVVFADQVIRYDKRKLSAQGVRPRGEAQLIEPWLAVHLNDFFVDRSEPAVFSAAKLSIRKKFKTFRGPIGSGNAVVGFREARERGWLTGYNDKTLVLETEADGFAQAFYEDRLLYGAASAGYLVVRGVSDHADHKKDDRWRKPAALNAAGALQEFLGALPPIYANMPWVRPSPA